MRSRTTGAIALLLACSMAFAWSCGGSGPAKRAPGTGGSAGGSTFAATGGSAGQDASVGAGGRLGTGGEASTGSAAGGTSASTGGATTTGTGNSDATGGTLAVGAGGATATGGTTAVGAGGKTTLGTGGAPATGGRTGSGGTNVTGGTTGSGGARFDGGDSGCACTQGTTSWECYCSAYDCTTSLDYYQPPDGGSGPWVIAYEEYAGCRLGVVTTKMGPDLPLRHVFDLSTGRLVGEERGTDYPTKCPFGPDAGSFQKLGAGVLGPDPGCVRTKCTGSSTLTGTLCGDAGI